MIRRSLAALSMLSLGGCPISKAVGDGVDSESSESGDGSVSMSSTTIASTTGTVDDSGGDSGAGDDGVYVDCADAAPGWPTVGPGVAPGPLGFPPFACNPRVSGEALGYRCCSDDPSAPGGALPAYAGYSIDGDAPFFADANNAVSAWGMCVHVDDIPAGVPFTLISPAAEGCPVPCDPTWSADDVNAVCGESRRCCQTLELQAKDCVLDTETSQWRPVTGDDVYAGLSTWAPASHATHQDPNGNACLEIAGGDPSAPEFEDCVRQLHVANRRGYCMSVASCPSEGPGYIDACEAMNG